MRTKFLVTLLIVLFSSQFKTISAQAKDLFYVVDATDNKVLVIDGSTHTLIKSIPVGERPWGVAVNNSGTYAYVANTVSNTISVIDTNTQTIADTISLSTYGSQPVEIAIDPLSDLAYVANVMSPPTVIDTSKNSIVSGSSGNYGGDFSLAVDSSGKVLYGNSSYNSSIIQKFDITQGQLTNSNSIDLALAPTEQAFRLMIDAPRSRLYISESYANPYGNGTNGKVFVIDTKTNAIIKTLTVGKYPTHLTLHPSGNFAYVVNSEGGDISVIDMNQSTVTETFSVSCPDPWDMAFNQAGNEAYITCPSQSAVLVVDTQTHNLIGAPIAVGKFPGAIANQASASSRIIVFSPSDNSTPTSTPPTLAFDNTSATPFHSTQSFVFKNDTSLPWPMDAIEITDGFAQQNNCQSALAVGESCNFTVSLTKVFSSITTGSLTLQDPTNNRSYRVALTANGGVSDTPTAGGCSLQTGNENPSFIFGMILMSLLVMALHRRAKEA